MRGGEVGEGFFLVLWELGEWEEVVVLSWSGWRGLIVGSGGDPWLWRGREGSGVKEEK